VYRFTTGLGPTLHRVLPGTVLESLSTPGTETPTPIPQATYPAGEMREIRVDAPPRLDDLEPEYGVVSGLLPTLAGLGTVALIVTAGDQSGLRSRGLLTGAAFVLVTLGVVAAQLDRQRRRRGRVRLRMRTAYLRHLDDVRARSREAATQQRTRLLESHPTPSTLPTIAQEGSRVWTGTGTEEGHLRVRYGVRRGAPAVPFTVGARSDGEDPVAAAALEALLAVHGHVPGLPAVADLSACSRIEILGSTDEARALARSMICAASTLHPPTALRLAVLAAPESQPAWDWVKWLPHVRSPLRVDAAGWCRLVAADPDHLTTLLPSAPDGHGPGDPRLLLVIDGVVPGTDQILLLRQPRTTTLFAGHRARPDDQSDIVLTLEPRNDAGEVAVRVEGSGADPAYAVADQCDTATATALARRLTGRREVTGAPCGTDLADLLDHLGVHDTAYDWRPRTARDRLRVPIGIAPDGSHVDLDLKEPAEHGMGPHGLVVGATGSGKSELLRTLVLGLALTHSPEQLNLVLIDFKGGATFAGLAALPHVSAAITNLADDLTLVDRMDDALSGEVVRREEALRRTGHASVRDHERARAAGARLAPFPSLLVVVDELAELLSCRPELVDLFVRIGRLGRSLAMHLLVSTQRLEEGRLRGLESHLSYRVGLRTFSAAESRAVLGVPDAAQLPAVPGRGLLRTDSSDPLPFTAAYVSARAHRPEPPPEPPLVTGPMVIPWTTADVGRVSPAFVAPTQQRSELPSFLDDAVARMATSVPPARRIWLPPLDRPPTLDTLMPDLAPDPRLGLVSSSWRAERGLTVPIGLLDRPRDQRQDRLTVDLHQGHVVLVGGPTTGKTTLLRTLALGVSLTRTPGECQIYLLDLAAGLGTGLDRLPHLAGTATRTEPTVVRRLVAEVSGILDHREQRLRAHGIDPMETDTGFGDVVLVVDGWGGLRDLGDDVESDLQRLASRGLGLGVHLVAASTRWADFRPAVRDLFATRLELRLGDPADSEVDRRAAAAVPRHRPGRGLSPDGDHFLGALPRIDGDTDPCSSRAAVAALVRRVAGAWPGPPAPRLRLLPELVTTGEVAAESHRARSGLLLLALDEQHLAPVGLDPRADPHWLVLGDGGSGRTSALRTYLHALARARTPETARIVVVDPRRSLLGEVPDTYLLDHLTSTVRATPALEELAHRLEQRLPDPAGSLPEVFVVVDDHDLLTGPHGSPLMPLLPLLPAAADVGLHLALARRAVGASRAAYEPVLQRLRDLGTPGLLLSGDPDEGPLLGRVRAMPATPGRGRWVSRQRDVRVVQMAWCPPRPGAPPGIDPGGHRS
jgi:DNA segregation ATPase FtsK/SpoIIIE, S-DNA-T family